MPLRRIEAATRRPAASTAAGRAGGEPQVRFASCYSTVELLGVKPAVVAMLSNHWV
jgi:hypothetical protein